MDIENKRLEIGDKVYRPAWNEDGTPFIWEEEVMGYKYDNEGRIRIYICKRCAFSKSLIGKSYYLTKEEAEKEHERIKREHPNGLPLLKPHGRR